MKFPELVILDRDGVLNRTFYNPKEDLMDSPMEPSQAEVFDGVPKIIAEMTRAGIKLYIATNQPAAKKGKTTFESLNAAHQKIVSLCESAGGRITGSEICYDLREENSQMRKPAPGMLLKILSENPHVNPALAWMVGDRETDIEAGRRAGMKTAYLGEAAPKSGADYFGRDLAEFWAYLQSFSH